MTELTTEERNMAGCDVAMGRVARPADTAGSGTLITAAKKDISARGTTREHWYRMVWRSGAWQYFACRRLATGTYLASDRRDSVEGEVFLGEIVCSHDRGGKVDDVRIVILPDSQGRVLRTVEFRRSAGKLVITLPDGSVLTLPDPRK